MSVFALLNHLLNFSAPALAVALLLVGGARLVFKPKAPVVGGWAQVGLVFAAGWLVLLGGLLATGHDGRMGTYATLVVVAASTQWGLMRIWRD